MFFYSYAVSSCGGRGVVGGFSGSGEGFLVASHGKEGGADVGEMETRYRLRHI